MPTKNASEQAAQSAPHVHGPDPDGVMKGAHKLQPSDFSTGANPEVFDDSIPWVSLDGEISNPDDVDFYRFTLQEGDGLVLDIDHGMPDVDTVLHVFDSSGNVVAVNDDSFPEDPGSEHPFDSYLEYTAPTNGQYFVSVTSFPNFYDSSSGTWPGGGSAGDYTLNASIVDAIA